MNFKPDEATWMAYVYGELSAEEHAQVEAYLEQNPDQRKRVAEWQTMRQWLRQAQDQEVIAPPVLVEDTKPSFWHSAYWRLPLGIAAGVLLVLVTAKLLQVNIRYEARALTIAFGETKPSSVAVPVQALTTEQVQQMIDRSVSENGRQWAADWRQQQAMVTRAIQTNHATNNQQMDELVNQVSAASQDQIRAFVASLREENQRAMKEYLTLSATEQKLYMENLLVDFSKYLTEQRNQDLALFQNKLLTMESNTNQFKQETEQLLTSLIANSGTGSKTKLTAY
ncbi:MAG: hypothetical protein MUC38_05820 [Cyclobacteriaceae bacterium]|jgi:hypothetical protein|nr:hypothetical protein [Cyclobacteriaceae bacterium]